MHVKRQIVDQTGIDEAMIERLVRTFYGRVLLDSRIGPIFAARVKDWESHIARLCDFWSSIALKSGRYHGQPMQMHAKLPVDASHFDRWLELFEAAAKELCPPAAAAYFIEHARRIADSLEMEIAVRQGRIHNPRHSVSETRLNKHSPA
jgi:hemoglobin